MHSSPDEFRQDLARALSTDARATVSEWRGEDADVARWPRWEVLDDVRAGLEPAEFACAAMHLHRAAAVDALEPARDVVRAAGERRVRFERADRLASEVALELGRSPDAHRLLGPIARDAAEHAGRRVRDGLHSLDGALPEWADQAGPDSGPPADELLDSAREFLDATDDAASELTARHGIEEGAQWFSFFRERARDLLAVGGRHRRVAEVYRELDVRSALERAARLERPASAFRSRVVPVAPGNDVRIALPSALSGAAAELETAEAVGRALGYALIHPSLPVALRFPVNGTVARALGALTARVALHPLALRRRGLSGRESEECSRIASAWVFLRARLAAAGALADERLPTREPVDAREAGVGRALGVQPMTGGAWLTSTAFPRVRFRAARGALSLFIGLRDHLDEDWWRNPRTSEVLRSACARGGGSSVEEWCESLDARSATESALALLG